VSDNNGSDKYILLETPRLLFKRGRVFKGFSNVSANEHEELAAVFSSGIQIHPNYPRYRNHYNEEWLVDDIKLRMSEANTYVVLVIDKREDKVIAGMLLDLYYFVGFDKPTRKIDLLHLHPSVSPLLPWKNTSLP